MKQDDDKYIQAGNALEIAQHLAALMENSGASLLLDKPGSKQLPVVLLRAEPDEPLLIDVSSAGEAIADLKNGTGFRLLGDTEGRSLRSGVLLADSWQLGQGRITCEAPFPEDFGILQRRDTYRAVLRHGMECKVTASWLDAEGSQCSRDGQLIDLSLEGCMAEFPLSAAGILSAVQNQVLIELTFPNERRFGVQAEIRHQQGSMAQRNMRAGFRFVEPSVGQSRELWMLVREIEREAARSAGGTKKVFAASPLFKYKGAAPSLLASRRSYATPMSRQLAVIGEFLHAQILTLRNGGNIDSSQLSRYSERLLGLRDQDRESLLFATVCLHDEPWLIRHSLGVAVRLVDLAGESLPREVHKAIAASALVHDLGRALLPPELEHEAIFDSEKREELHQHVDLLLPRLSSCSWVSPAICDSIVAEANERLDGSGYPRRKTAKQLREMARMMAVVDTVDILGQNRPGVAAQPVGSIYTYMLSRPREFDSRWVKRYLQHFGRMPVGSMVRYPTGKLAWVLATGSDGRPSLVQLATRAVPPTAHNLGELVTGRALAAMGPASEVLPADSTEAGA